MPVPPLDGVHGREQAVAAVGQLVRHARAGACACVRCSQRGACVLTRLVYVQNPADIVTKLKLLFEVVIILFGISALASFNVRARALD